MFAVVCCPGSQRRAEVVGQFLAEGVGVAFQGDCGQSLVLGDQFVGDRCSAVVEAELEAQFGLPAVPQTLQDAVVREVVEEPVGRLSTMQGLRGALVVRVG